jgi:membrane protein required for colicin V production
MNALDIVLIVLAVALLVYGFVRGFMRLLVMVVALVVAYVLASRFHQTAAGWIPSSWLSADVRKVIGYVVIFLAVMLVGGLVGWLLRKLVAAAMLGLADRIAGAVVGMAVAVLAAALLILPFVAYVPHGPGLLAGSRLAPYVAPVADLANKLAPDDLEAKYRDGIERLRRVWRGDLPPLEPGPAKPSAHTAKPR